MIRIARATQLAVLVGAVLVGCGPRTTPPDAGATGRAASALATATGDMAFARRAAPAVRLANGKVLVAGGGTDAYGAGTAELYDPDGGTFALTGALDVGRVSPWATLLPDGTVLVSGGYGWDDPPTVSDELYDPVTGSWTVIGSDVPRRGAAVATLSDGRVLVTGGFNSGGMVTTTRIFDPATRAFSAAAPMSVPRYGAPGVTLDDGRVLVAGGTDFTGGAVATAEIYDPATDSWSFTGSLPARTTGHTLTKLLDGRVLAAGGVDQMSTRSSGNGTTVAYLFHPFMDSWSTTGSMASARHHQDAFLTSSGRVVVLGGVGGSYGNVPVAAVEVYDPTSGQWTTIDPLDVARGYAAVAALGGDRFLLAGGTGPDGVVRRDASVYALPCMPRTCEATSCGAVADGCGGTLSCARCGADAVCVENTCVFDVTPPTVALTAPGAGQVLSGTMTFAATVSDDGMITWVEFLVDEQSVTWVAAAPYVATWPTFYMSNGPHQLRAIAHDAAGNVGRSEPVAITVANDVVGPAVVLTAPTADAQVSGRVKLSVDAADESGVASVLFQVDGTTVATAATAPYEVDWDSRTVGNGAHWLAALACDVPGNCSWTSPVWITVQNDFIAPSISLTAPEPGVTASGTVALAATAADDSASVTVTFEVDGVTVGTATAEPYTIDWDSTTVANGWHNLLATACDAARNCASAGVGFGTVNEVTPPTVTLVGLAAGATVSGPIYIDVKATDDIAVTGIETFIDDRPLGTCGTSGAAGGGAVGWGGGGMECIDLWDTHYEANGAHTVTARAYDASGKVGQVAITVTTENDRTPPTVALTAPAAGTYSGAVEFTATAADASGVAYVRYVVDEVSIGTATASPYAFTWDSTTVANGAHTVVAIACDPWNCGRGTPVTINVLNDKASPTVTFTSPQDGATLSGTVTVAVNAADDVGVTRVEFYGDTQIGVVEAPPWQIAWNTRGLANGPHALVAKAYDASGKSSKASVSVTLANDFTPPSVAVTAPASFATVSGTVSFAATAVDQGGVSSVTFAVDGVQVGVDASAPYGVGWDSTLVANGQHIVQATACDGWGNCASDARTFGVVNDRAAPTAAITTPAAGATLSGTVAVSASASDDVGVARVEFYDGAALLGTATAAPWGVTWDTRTAANGAHALTARAYDASGKTGASAPVSVTTSNDFTAPTVAVSSPAAGATVAGVVALAATATDATGVASVRFAVDGADAGTATSAPYGVSWDSTRVANGAHVITATACDTWGSCGTSAPVGITVLNDRSAPVVAITAPAAGATVSGTVTVAATASDDVGVTRVEFYDGAALLGTSTAAPWSIVWNTPGAANGAHTLTARAYDASGKSATSAAVGITVKNDVTAPTVRITAPASGARVGGTAVAVSASATDDVGVVRVEFYLDGTKLLGTDTTAPYAVTWNTVGVVNGTHALTAKAYDAAGNAGASASVSVTVKNGGK